MRKVDVDVVLPPENEFMNDAFSFSTYFRSKQTPGIKAILSQCEITHDLTKGEIVITARHPSFAEALLLADFTNTLNLNIRLIARGFNRLKPTKTASS